MRKARKLSCARALSGLGLAAGCSSPVPPASQGALSVYLNAPISVAGSCPPGAHWINVPFAQASGQQIFASSNNGGVAVDGVGEMGVSCTVKDNGSGGFNANGTLKSPAVDAMGNRLPTSTLVTFNATVAPGQPGQGTLTVSDYRTATTYLSDACIFSITPVQSTDLLGAAPGRMWAQVNCPMFRDPLSSDMRAVCQIETGYIILENCAQ
jgi:hypothetical protein